MATDTARTIKLDADGDFDVSTGTLVILKGSDSIVQAVKIALQCFKGEWFLDPDSGVPFFQDVLVKNPDPSVLQTVFRDAILEVPGVLALNALELAQDRGARTLTVTFRVSTDVGELDGSVSV